MIFHCIHIPHCVTHSANHLYLLTPFSYLDNFFARLHFFLFLEIHYHPSQTYELWGDFTYSAFPTKGKNLKAFVLSWPGVLSSRAPVMITQMSPGMLLRISQCTGQQKMVQPRVSSCQGWEILSRRSIFKMGLLNASTYLFLCFMIPSWESWIVHNHFWIFHTSQETMHPLCKPTHLSLTWYSLPSPLTADLYPVPSWQPPITL